MGEIVNLKRVRKEKARHERDSAAAANRRRFGRTREQRLADEAEADRNRQSMDGKRLEPDKP
jgi:hypothetical protein